MSWYYAGPEAKPVGPVTLEDLQARRQLGTIGAETYVIEHTGQPGVVGTWRRYRELFPESVAPSTLPPLPQAVPAVPVIPIAAPHALFPSAGATPPLPQPTYTPNVAPHAAPHGHYSVGRTNAWCSWGFGLAVAGFILSLFCGVGLLLAGPALLICLIGFVLARAPQTGRGLAVAGGGLAILGQIISICFLVYLVPWAIKERENAAKSQNSE